MSKNIRSLQKEMIEWRHYLHMHPETAFNEVQTSDYIANLLDNFGLTVHRGLAKTGVVASLSAGKSQKRIGLRADIDALNIKEENDISYKSINEGKMHACGHDGHTAMLLGAAKYLSETRYFDGTVYFIFQPAEETKAGGKKMIEDGLFELFPADSIYGMHNMPDIPAGHFAVKAGPVMASMDTFEITINGVGGHAAMPHLTSDPFVITSNIINAIQTIVSRNIHPYEAAVLSITQIHGGNSWNIIPGTVTLRGTFRCFKQEIKEKIVTRLTEIISSVCIGHNATSSVIFNPIDQAYPVTNNSEYESKIAADTAIKTVGKKNVDLAPIPSLASEDFAFMLQEKPGCYIWLGNGPVEKLGSLHNPNYNFNDAIMHIGASYWIELVESVLNGS